MNTEREEEFRYGTRARGFYEQATIAEEPTSVKDCLSPTIEEIAPLV
jgi:hypothetical protein